MTDAIPPEQPGRRGLRILGRVVAGVVSSLALGALWFLGYIVIEYGKQYPKRAQIARAIGLPYSLAYFVLFVGVWLAVLLGRRTGTGGVPWWALVIILLALSALLLPGVCLVVA